ncbi:hypothetical protein RUM44_011993 [Polyplax serrata]|uniref:Endonuclease/exonuclease/phosphatase domain-containing protein n=1 Tax=Polyplax serrata TaxID=468196 RepID=A0ABR1BE06_POLSC
MPNDIIRQFKKHKSSAVIIGGNFSANSITRRNNSNNTQGKNLENWAAEMGIFLVNDNLSATCRRPQGETVIDLTWATVSLLTWQLKETRTLQKNRPFTHGEENCKRSRLTILHDRHIIYVNSLRETRKDSVTAGVPHGSILSHYYGI